jgi:hypothetical protein
MSIRRRLSVDRMTIGAICLLWGIAFIVALLTGLEPLPAAFESLAAASLLGFSYVLADDRDSPTGSLVATPLGVLGFSACGLIMAAISFAGDCLMGSMFHPNLPSLEACTTGAGIGFAFTVLIIVMVSGVTLTGFLRLILIAAWKHVG